MESGLSFIQAVQLHRTGSLLKFSKKCLLNGFSLLPALCLISGGFFHQIQNVAIGLAAVKSQPYFTGT